MKQIYTLFAVIALFNSNAQTPSIQNESDTNYIVNWGINQNRATGDSCGVYYNNYVGRSKTNIIRQEYMRNDPAGNFFNGRAQRFEAPQPIEISGLEFYSFIDNEPSVTSVMVITMLNEYDALTDSVGIEMIRDTVYVTHDSYNPLTDPLPNISVQSTFDSAVTVTSDYIVSIFTPTDHPLIIITNEPTENAGNGENLSYALYSNTGFPSFPPGWYNMSETYGANGDYDFLIAPKVKYDLKENFVLDEDSICPGIAGNACVTYNQVPIFANGQYNTNASNNNSAIRWNWGDGTGNAGLASACHTYQNSGNYSLTLEDTIYLWDYNTDYCLTTMTQNVVALDSVTPDFTFINTNLTVDFTSTASFADSVWWDFGNDSIIGGVLNPTMEYDSVSTFDVWLHVINECTEDSIMYQVTTDDVGINEVNRNSVKVYPNPANDKLTLEKLPNDASVEIYSITGELVYFIEIKSNQNEIAINVNDFIEGTYVVKIKSSEVVSVQKILITH
jgi:PKD repeat protein